MNGVFTRNIDMFPYTGERDVEGFLKISERSFLDPYYNGASRYVQVKNVTRGKIYKVVRAIGYGDVEDFVIIDDIGEEHTLGSFFFEEITDEEYKSMTDNGLQKLTFKTK
jgi:hypothetical protein